MGSHANKTPPSGKQIEIDKSSLWGKLWMMGAVMAAAGLGGWFLLKGHDEGHAWSALLTAYFFAWAISLGGLFFVIVQHLVRAQWSITVRRTAEHMSLGIPLVGLVGLLIAFGGSHSLYEWTHDEVPYETTDSEICGAEALAKAKAHQADHGHVIEPGETVDHDGPMYQRSWVRGEPVSCFKLRPIEEDEMISAKRAYLNEGSFKSRAIAFYLLLSGLAIMFWRWSTTQDKLDPEKDREKILKISVRARYFAAPALIIFAMSLTFGAFDFLMSLDPHWFSTIFGVYIFAGSSLTMFSFMALILTLLRKSGHLEGVVTSEHFHDLGKFMFGFTVFWAYIGFSQYFLIWYADIPEETHWFAYRGHGQWLYVSLAVVFGRFVVPWFGLLRRGWKRNMNYLIFAAVFIICMEYVDMFWLVQPAHAHHAAVAAMIELDFETAHTVSTHVHVGALDALAVLGTFGLFLTAFGWSLANNKLIPINDPRIRDAINHENF